MALLGLSTSIATAQVRAEIATNTSIVDRDTTDSQLLFGFKTHSMQYVQNQKIEGTAHLLQQIALAVQTPSQFLVEFEVIEHRNYVVVLKITLMAANDRNGKKIGKDVVIYDASTANDY